MKPFRPSTRLILTLAGALSLGLAACSKTGEPPPATATAPAPAAFTGSSYDRVGSTGRGFTVGSMMSAQPVYVLFEPQCPHCGHLWNASLALHNKVKFVWIPVAFNDGKSLKQAAALLSAAQPLETMTEHEAALLGGRGGLPGLDPVPDDLAQAVKGNTQLMTQLGLDSVPFVLAKNRRTGEVVSHNGAMETTALAQLLGVD